MVSSGQACAHLSHDKSALRVQGTLVISPPQESSQLESRVGPDSKCEHSGACNSTWESAVSVPGPWNRWFLEIAMSRETSLYRSTW